MFSLYTVDNRTFGLDGNGNLQPAYLPVIYHPHDGKRTQLNKLIASGRRHITVVYDMINPKEMLHDSCVPPDIAEAIISRLHRIELPELESERRCSYGDTHSQTQCTLLSNTRFREPPKAYWHHQGNHTFNLEGLLITMVGGVLHDVARRSIYDNSSTVFSNNGDYLTKEHCSMYTGNNMVILLANEGFVDNVYNTLDGFARLGGSRGIIGTNGDVLANYTSDINSTIRVIY